MQQISGHNLQFQRTQHFIKSMVMLSVLPKVTLTWDAAAALQDLDIDGCTLSHANHPLDYKHYVDMACQLEQLVFLAHAILNLVH